jgi:peptidyl-prolyl cis-trans isomerase B (cyclophilin B)
MAKLYVNLVKASQKNKFIIIILIFGMILPIIAAIFISEKIIINEQSREIEYATIVTSKGPIKIKFRENAPKAVDNFINLARLDFYDETRIHRVVPNFMIQGGDPISKFDSAKDQWGTGGPGYAFKGEIYKDDKMKRGVVALALTDKKTNGSQFFILTKDADWLNNQHPIIGDVVEGMDVVDKISQVKIGLTGIPLSEVKIIDIKIW